MTATAKHAQDVKRLGPWGGIGVFVLAYALSFLLFYMWLSIGLPSCIDQDAAGGISWKATMIFVAGVAYILRPGILGQISFAISASTASMALVIGVLTANIAAGIQLCVGRLDFPSHDLLTIVLVAVVSPIIEEFFFRGIILNALLRRWPATVSVLISAILFASGHGSFWPSFISGLILSGSFLYFRRSLAISIIMHFGLNLAGTFPTYFMLRSLYFHRQ